MKNNYHNDIDQLIPLTEYNYENIFTVHQDGDFFFYNILKTVNFPKNMNDSYYFNHKIKTHTPYTTLSYKFYNTIKLWWLIAIANNINNPVQFIKPGSTLKIIKPDVVPLILTAIKDQLR